MHKLYQIGIFSLLLLFVFACKKESTPVAAGDDSNFTIVANDDNKLKDFNRKVEVFGISIYAVPTVEDAKLLHAANIMAQYLDNDEDGTPDNQTVLDAMLAENAFMVMWKRESDLNGIDPPDDGIGQDLGADETQIDWHNNGKTGRFDASLEEVLHIITNAGYAQAYPTVFGEDIGSELANAMDVARGGQFTSIPNPYPAEAWYSYDDRTCDYSCMATEYIYWALTSILDAQANRLDEIGHEWKLNTKALVEEQDTLVYELLTDPRYAFPTVLPDGTYKR